MSRTPFSIQLKHADWVTPNVRHLSFERTDEQPFPFIPGQFVTLHFQEEEGQPSFHRSYSLANLGLATEPQNNHLIEFAVSRVPEGRATEILFALTPQSSPLLATGPFGRLVLPERWDPTYRRLILIATGTGVTPYRSMLAQIRYFLQKGEVDQVILMLGVREKAELLYGKDFQFFESQTPGFHFIPCYSRETDALEGQAKRGYVQSHLPDLRLTPGIDLIYLCGNPNMIDEAYQKLSEMGFSSAQIRREKYISSKS